MADRPPFFFAVANRTTKRYVCGKTTKEVAPQRDPKKRHERTEATCFGLSVTYATTRACRSHLFWATCRARTRCKFRCKAWRHEAGFPASVSCKRYEHMCTWIDRSPSRLTRIAWIALTPAEDSVDRSNIYKVSGVSPRTVIFICSVERVESAAVAGTPARVDFSTSAVGERIGNSPTRGRRPPR